MTIKITKQLVTMEDLAIGTGTVVQKRNGVLLTLNKIPLDNRLIQVKDYTKARSLAGLVNGDQVSIAYRTTIGDGGGGIFVFNTADLSTEVTADTQSGIYVAPASDLTGASGAWVREYSGAVSLSWYGGNIHAAILAIGATETTLVIDTDATLTKDDTVPRTLTIARLAGNTIDPATFTLTMNGSFKDSPVVESIANLVSFQPLGITGEGVIVSSYHSGIEGGGGTFYWDATKDKALHNGGTVIDPAIVFPTDWTNQTQLTTWFTAGTGAGCWVRQFDGAVNVAWFGAKGDGVTDDTKVIQKALYLNGDGNELFPSYADLELFFPRGGYRITTTIHQPALTVVYGISKVSISSSNFLIDKSNSTVIFADFADLDRDKSAWVITGYSRNALHGLTDDDLIDPYLLGSTDSDYIAGNFTRVRRCTLKGLTFLTENYVSAGVSFMASADIEVNVNCHGFLYGVCGYTSWTANLAVYGNSYYCGLFLYSPNGVNVKGYLSGYSDSTGVPDTLENTIPFGWSTYETTGYTGADRFWSTGLYCSYTNAVTCSSLVTEAFDRGRFFNNCEGVTDNSPYLEKIFQVAYNVISSTVNVSAPQNFAVPYWSQTGGGNSTSLVLRNVKAGDTIVSKVNQETYEARPRVLVSYTDQRSIHVNEPYNDAVRFEFIRKDPITIYIDGTSGNDSNTGLSMGNAVQSMTAAVLRCRAYTSNRIVVKEATTVTFTGFPLVDFNLLIEPETTTATVLCEASGGVVRGMYVNNGAKVIFRNLTLNTEASTTTSTRGLIKPSGACSIEFLSCVFGFDVSTALVNPTYLGNAVMSIAISKCSGALDKYGLNPYLNQSAVKVLFSEYENTYTTSATWGTNFSVL